MGQSSKRETRPHEQRTTEGDRPKATRAPRYRVFELQRVLYVDDPSDLETGGQTEYIEAWVCIGENVAGATDRKAITSIIGTPAEPAEGFDADRRLLPHAAVLMGQWHERRLKREVHKPTKEEAAKLKALLDGTVTEEWES